MQQPGLDTVKRISRVKVNIRLTKGHRTRFDLSWTYQMTRLNYPSPPLASTWVIVPFYLLPITLSPLCLEPTKCDKSAYSGGFFALTNFLGQSSAERRTDVYVLTFTAPVDDGGQTGRMGETLCLLSTADFLFFMALSPRCQLAFLHKIPAQIWK